MATRWNNDGPCEAHALSGRQPGLAPKVVRLGNLDPWLAATLVDDLFDRRFLWASDCDRLRFAALGESRSVAFNDLKSAVSDAAKALDLPSGIASRLPLGLYVRGERDGRPGAFASGEAETRPLCWIPKVLLVADRNDLLVYCPDTDLLRGLVARLDLANEGRGPLVLGGRQPDITETALDDQDTWRGRVERALTGIRAGGLEKLVVSRRLVYDSSFGALSPWASAWQAGNATRRTGFSISTDGGSSMFVGATPETLLRVHDGALTTHALAGTRDCDATLEDFLASNKLAREHTLVSDGLVTKLSPQVSHIRPGPLRVRRSGSVAHLETPLSGNLRPGADPLQILSDLHPTAAIGGMPQRSAQEALRQIEPYSRGWFAAPVGWLAAGGNMHAAIAIRSLWVSARRAVALAGAGIVRGSVAEEEWAETESKFDNMRALLRGQLFGK